MYIDCDTHIPYPAANFRHILYCRQYEAICSPPSFGLSWTSTLDRPASAPLADQANLLPSSKALIYPSRLPRCLPYSCVGGLPMATAAGLAIPGTLQCTL
jgi:hypothetical protein